MVDNRTFAGAIATVMGAGIWGLIWLPIQHLDQLGVSGLWTVVLIQPAAAIAALIFILASGTIRGLKGIDNWLVGLCFGLSTMLYFAGILLSDVVRVIFLFYTLPVWTILWNRLFFGVIPKPKHYIVIAIALVGLWLLLSGGHSWVPRPKNLGDWCGILAGAMWGMGLAILEHRRNTSANATCFVSFFSAFLFAAIVLMFTQDASFNATSSEALNQGFGLAMLIGAGLQFPIMYLMVWGGQRLSAPTAALLTMSEIIAASVSASIILGSALTAISWIGGIIIVCAAVVDIIYDIRNPEHPVRDL